MAFAQFQFRRDIAANWTAANPVLAEGEIGLELDTDQFKIGDGLTVWASLAYGGIQGIQGPAGPGSTVPGPQGDPGATGPAGPTGSVSSATGLTLDLVAEPATPAADKLIIYASSVDGLIYKKDDLGGVQAIGVGGGSSGGASLSDIWLYGGF